MTNPNDVKITDLATKVADDFLNQVEQDRTGLTELLERTFELAGLPDELAECLAGLCQVPFEDLLLEFLVEKCEDAVADVLTEAWIDLATDQEAN